MKNNYLKPVAIKDIKLHGDFAAFTQTASVIRIKNIRADTAIPVVTCKLPKEFQEESGYEHTSELFIRSRLMDSAGLKYDVEIVNWRTENDICRKALEDNETIEDLGYTAAYDDYFYQMFDESSSHHYEFDLPKEMVVVLPIDLDESQFLAIPESAMNTLLDHMAWRQIISMLPVTNIREVPNEPEASEDPEMTKLWAMETFVVETVNDMFNHIDDEDFSGEKYSISVELNGRKFELGCCAKEYQGLLEYINFMKSEI